MTAGETVGEMALLSGEPRSATVVALRDTELARLSKTAFTKLIDEHPKALRFVTDLLVRRLRQPPRLAPAARRPEPQPSFRSIAISPPRFRAILCQGV